MCDRLIFHYSPSGPGEYDIPELDRGLAAGIGKKLPPPHHVQQCK